MTATQNLQAAFEAYGKDDLDVADKLVAAVIENTPDYAKAYQLKALIAVKRRDIQTADKSIQRAFDLDPQDAEILNTRGNIFKMTGRVSDAVASYKASLKIAPNYPTATQNLGELYLMEKDPIQAAAVFENFLVHAPDHPIMTQGLLYALKDAQQTDAALGLLSNMPQSPGTALPAGQLLAANNQTFQARQSFLQALSDPRSAPTAFRNLVQIAWRKDGLESGRSEISDIIKQAPQAGFLYIHGADLLAEMGDIPAAFALLDTCEMQFGPQADIEYARADLYIKQGNGEDAFEKSDSALKQRPGDLTLTPNLARAALMVERYDVALDISRQMQHAVPNNQFWIAIEATAQRGLELDHTWLYDYDKFVRPYDLDPPPEYDTLEEFLTQLKSDLDERHTSKHHPISQSLRGGTQTSADLRFAASRVIQDFFQALERPITDYMHVIGNDPDHPLTRRNTGRYRLTGSWSVKLHGDGFHVNHVHPEGWISSAFYVDVPNGTDTDPKQRGSIKFGEPPFKVPGMGPEHVVAPRAGQLVLFPSYMWHGTIPIAKGASRMTLPFDAVPAWGA